MQKRRRTLAMPLGLLMVALLLVGCGEPLEEKRVTGEITCSEDANLPSHAVVWVRIQEIRPQGRPNSVGEQSIPWPGECPIAFDVTYDPDDIKPSKKYVLLVTVLDGNDILYAGLENVITYFRPTSNVRIRIVNLEETGGVF